MKVVLRSAVAAALLALSGPASGAVSLPVLRSQVPAGGGSVRPLAPAFDPARTVDGSAADWTGRTPGFGGALAYSHGELVYSDHVFDAYGADNGQDAQRLALLDPATAAVPELYRLDPAYQYVPGEFGIPTGPLTTETHYGDLPHADEADLSEVRLGTDAQRDLWLLARTTTMKDTPGTALLVLLDTEPGSATRSVPFGSGLTTTAAEVAVLLTRDHATAADLRTGAVHELPAGSVAFDPAGYENAVEARLPADLLGGDDTPRVAVAAGLANADATKLQAVANVAFRTAEPARDWWDKQQALALQQGTIDPFFAEADLGRMAAGANERYVPGPGYHDRIFSSAPEISKETGGDGILQHYGVYLPDGYRAGHPSPVQWWFHFRGGNAHIAAAVAPGIFQDMGADQDSVVVTPDGRGTSGWYVGKSQLDFLEVWRDVHHLLSLDRNREYIAGHSMGGWASYLLPILYPDRFAASFPASGPVTQGAFTGLDFDGCDDLEADGETPCYTSANGGDARAELTTPLLGNLLHVPVAIYQGTEDELVPVSGVLLQAKRLQDLGQRYRLYLFPHQEHYGPPIQDQWSDGARYEHQFVRDRNPARVTYQRSMRFEHAVNTVNSDGVDFGFTFDRAYWMSDLQPADAAKGVASVDARSLAIRDVPHALVPEAGGPAATDQTGPYAMAGQAWKDDPAGAPALHNGFSATLTGAREVRFAMRRMSIDTQRRVSGDVTTEAPLTLRLSGPWPDAVSATLDGDPVAIERTGNVVTVAVPAGHHALVLSP